MKIVFFGLSITSSWGNGHATTYRSLVKGLAHLGHQIHFVEKEVPWYRDHRDMNEAIHCTLHIYQDWKIDESCLLSLCADADAIIIGSYFPDAIAASQVLLNTAVGPLLFYDIDTPVTLAALRANGGTGYLDASLIPHYAAYLSFSGGPVLEEIEQIFGSPRAYPFYCSVDPDSYAPTQPCRGYECDLSYLGTYASDRQPKLTSFLIEPARRLPLQSFIIAGSQYPSAIRWGSNVNYLQHVPPPEHSSFYSSARFTLNITRSDMVAAGYSPSVRLFEASACGAAIISDGWAGLELFLTPGEEVLTPRTTEDVLEMLIGISDEQRKRIGSLASERILAEHTSILRAKQLEKILSESAPRVASTGLFEEVSSRF